MGVPAISVIIPTLNEAEGISRTLESLTDGGLRDILVVDGGSSDDTVSIATTHGCRVLEAIPGGRAGQMNRGAAETTGETLLFLHGDTTVSTRAIERLQSRLEADPGIVGGGFSRYFKSPSLFLKLTCWLAGIRSRWFGIFLGDQGMFVRRHVFETLGGFNESLSYGEDLDFSMQLRNQGKTVTISPPVLSSARRFDQRGPFGQTKLDFQIARQIMRESNKRMACS